MPAGIGIVVLIKCKQRFVLQCVSVQLKLLDRLDF